MSHGVVWVCVDLSFMTVKISLWVDFVYIHSVMRYIRIPETLRNLMVPFRTSGDT